MADLCDDGRFELIEKFKLMLMESTNISDSKDELNVLDTILFRFWQMGWLDKLEQPTAQQWIPCSERLPDEDYWMGGTGKQFSATVLVTVSNHEDEDEWVDMSYTVDGEWMLELPRYCKIVAWMPLPDPWKGEQE